MTSSTVEALQDALTEAADTMRVVSCELQDRGDLARSGRLYRAACALEAASKPHQIEAQGSEPTRLMVAKIIDARLMAEPYGPERGAAQNDIDRAQADVLARADEIIAALTRPDPSLGSRENLERAFKAGWNAHETGLDSRADGASSGFAMFLRGHNFGDEEIGQDLTFSPPSLGMEGVRECAEQFLHDVEDGLTWNSSSSQCLDRVRYLTVLFRKALASISTPSGEAG